MRTCPFCAEDIKDAAIVCKHCGRDLPLLAEQAATPERLVVAASQSAPPAKKTLPFFATGRNRRIALALLTSGFILTFVPSAEAFGTVLVAAGMFWIQRPALIPRLLFAVFGTAVMIAPAAQLNQGRLEREKTRQREAQALAAGAAADAKAAAGNWEGAAAELESLKKLKGDDGKIKALEARIGPELSRIRADHEAADRTKLVDGAISNTTSVVSDPKRCGEPQDVKAAWDRLKQVQRTDSRWEEAAALANRLEQCRQKAGAALDKSVAGLMVFQREQWAEKAERTMLDNGMDVTVSLSGAAKDRATLKWALMGRPTVHKLTEGGSMAEGSFLAGLQKIGFRRVTFTDGYDYSVFYDLAPQSEQHGGNAAMDGLGLGQPLALK